MKNFLGKAKGALKVMLARKKFESVYHEFREYTMISRDWYVANLELVVNSRVPERGAIVECGTWKGGMIAGIGSLLGKKRQYHLFDSFEGLPPARDIDGESAINWQKEKDPANYFDNCTASESDAINAMSKAGIQNPILNKGWFSDTLPGAKFENGISILRMDADWYDSTMDIFNNLFEQVLPGGLILIDDYYTWDGCTRAVHDYLSEHKRPERITTHRGVCYMIKR